MLCSHCGHDNPRAYHFCGMCGAAMEKPSPAPPPARPDVYPQPPKPDAYPPPQPQRPESPPPSKVPEFSASRSISGPSFLGLDAAPSAESSYLLEDEPGAGRGRVVALLLLVAVGAVGWWQVRERGGVSAVIASVRSMIGQHSAQPAGPQGGEGVPADRLNRSKAALQENATDEKASQSEDLEVKDGSLVPKPGETAAKAGTSDAASQDSSSASKDARAKPQSQPAGETGKTNADEAVGKKGSADEESSSTGSNSRGATEQASLKESSNKSSAAARKGGDETSVAEDASRRRASAVEDSQVANAEKYLYGKGVRQDCGRALSALRPAADDSNPKARTLLGAMYATGHCVPRNLPSSYHWFAMALREDPNNVWVARNLQNVWNQMSASERQQATQMK